MLVRVVLCLCLLRSSHPEELVVLSPWDFVSLHGTSTDGAAVSLTDMTWVTLPLPASDWLVATWAYMGSGTPDSAQLLHLSTARGIPFYMTWPTTQFPTFTYNTTPYVVNGSNRPVRQLNTWIYLVLGSNRGSSYGATVLRMPVNNVFSISWAETISIDRAFTLKGPVAASPFTVIST